MIKAVIFDLNGVFIESEWLSVRFNKEFGVSEDEFVSALKKIMEVVRRPGAPSAFSLWEPYLNNWKVNLNQDQFFHFWFLGETLVKEMIELSKELKQRKLKIFILSNNFRERTEFYRINFPMIFKTVDAAYFSWETGFVKPDKKAYLNLLETNSLKPMECIYFDDSERNVNTAKEVGINAFVYKGTEQAKKRSIEWIEEY